MQNYTIVVAEDEKLLLDNLIEKIERCKLGFQVVGQAQTGQDAWTLIQERHPDLVITDIKMPVMDGIKLLENVRLYYPLTKFIIVSGFSDFEYAKSAIQLQVSEYLLKPIDPDELYRTLGMIKNGFDLQQKEYQAIFSPGIATATPESIAHTLKDYLVQNFASDINLNLIATTMNYSASYLTKIFQHNYDTTPTKFITNLRISSAKQLLRASSLSIAQISVSVGYHDQGYFSRFFKKQTGVSPLDYREQAY